MSAARPVHAAARRRAALATLATLGILLGSIVGVAPPAGAWTEGECTDPTGVTVVIDFQELGGGVNVRCAPGPVATGFAALDAAGINYQTTIKFPGFLCKIAGKPGNDPCQTASPATAYWSYWIAARGGQWCYSNWGAGNRTPPPGSVEGWSFSLNKDGSTSPPPRYAVPAALPGTPPNQLAGNDCDPRADAPKPTAPADPGSGGAGAPAVPTPNPGIPSPGGTGGGAGTGGAGGPGAPTPNQPGAAWPEPVPGSPDPAVPGATVPGATVPGETTTSVAAVGEEPAAESTTSTTTTQDRRRLTGASEESGSVDLSSDGSSGGGSSPVGVLLAVALIAALGGGAFYVRRRASRT